MQAITPEQLANWLADPQRPRPVVLDVRELGEWQYVSIPGSTHIPLGELTGRLHELGTARAIVCLCHHGVRSMRASALLEHHGFGDVHNLSGGIDAYARTVDPSMPLY